MKYRIAVQLVLSLGCVVLTGLVLEWWAFVLWLGVFLYLAMLVAVVVTVLKVPAKRSADASAGDAVPDI